MKKLFILNQENQNTSVIDGLFDFMIIGFVALIFANFGKALIELNYSEISFSIANLILTSSTWYAYTFYSTRYQKKSNIYLFIMILMLIFLGIMGIGIKSYYFSHLKIAKFFFWSGYILSRFLMSSVYFLIDFYNKNKYVSSLVRFKYISRIITIFIICLFYNNRWINDKYLVILISIIEITGNLINVKQKNLIHMPILDYDHHQNRFAKLTGLYIGSFLIAALNFFGQYINIMDYKTLIIKFVLLIILGSFIWVIYFQRISRFALTNNAKSLVIFSTIGLVLDISFSSLGSVYLYAPKMSLLHPSIPLIGLLTIILCLLGFLFTANWNFNRLIIKKYKIYEYSIYLIVTILMICFNSNVWISLAYVFLILISLLINYNFQQRLAKQMK